MTGRRWRLAGLAAGQDPRQYWHRRIWVAAGDNAAAKAKDPRMELPVCAGLDDTALVLCRGRHGTQSPRRLDERHVLATAGQRVAPAFGGAIGRKLSR